ncbi:hypothetical protein PUN28_011374 [Cardiocondyla obscurior]|uniref:Uncharacterized protein n=1 Tax=Cardiocondyla obscurior TaxID=286306 RepID=A0AAW2FG10_9HYME
MWLYYGILIHLFGFLLANSGKAFDNAGKYPSSLENKLMVKLKTATRLKHNLGKVLHKLPIQSYEMQQSIKIIEDYLKTGGSLLDCLDILPSLEYAPIGEQINSILKSMEEHLPDYLLPAISFLRRSLSEGFLDVDEIYKPILGSPKVDPLEKISLKELKRATSPLTYQASVKDMKGPWPKIIGETAALIHDKILLPRSDLIAYMLTNLRIPDATTEARESIVLLVEHLKSHSKHELTGFKTSSDPYKLVVNTLSSLTLQNNTLIAFNVLLPFLRRPSQCRGSAEFGNLFFENNAPNYTSLICRDRITFSSKDGIALLSMIQQNTNVSDIIEQFFPFEYASWKDLLLAYVGQLRRQQTHQGEISKILDSVYGELILRTNRKRWKFLRNSIMTAPVLSAMARRETSVKIQRLFMDVALDRTVKPEIWLEALAFASSENVSGPISATIKTLKALLASNFIPSNSVLIMNIVELITIFDNRFNEEQKKCLSQLETYSAHSTQVEINREMTINNVDVKDLFQALMNLDTYTNEYRSLENFLSQSNLEMKIGQIDLNAHPTRGRLLAHLLQVIERTDSIDNNLRRLAKQFIDNVSYEGYGAGTLSYKISS